MRLSGNVCCDTAGLVENADVFVLQIRKALFTMRRIRPDEKQHLWARLNNSTHSSMKCGVGVRFG